MVREMRYVHGYSERETARLYDQATTLSAFLHDGMSFGPGRRVLEVGCGTGAQTIFLAANSPGAQIVSIDTAEDSLAQARARVESAGHRNVTFLLADLFDLPFAGRSFDDLFVCFVLEHLREPDRALRTLRRAIKPGGTITVIEGDHGSWYCHPQTEEAAQTVRCLIEIQARLGGDSLIGRRLHPLMRDAGIDEVRVIPRVIYADSSRPDLVEGFARKTFIAMVEGVREQALALGLIDDATWNKGIADMYRATERDGTFCYTFFRGTGREP